jgi:hypothetical protein
MKNADETTLDRLLPSEVVAKLREVVAQVLSQQPLPRAPILEGNVYRPMPTAFSQSSASVDPQLLQALLNDPDALKKIWFTPVGAAVAIQIAQLVVSLITPLCMNQEIKEQARQTEVFQKALVEQVEQFWVAHKDQPKPTPEKRKSRARSPGSLKDRTGAKRRKE